MHAAQSLLSDDAGRVRRDADLLVFAERRLPQRRRLWAREQG